MSLKVRYSCTSTKPVMDDDDLDFNNDDDDFNKDDYNNN